MTITVCVGSSCHIKGARQVIMRFNDMLERSGLSDDIELKGSFCMERCGEGLNWQIDDRPITSSSVDDAVETFRTQVIAPHMEAGTDKGRTPPERE